MVEGGDEGWTPSGSFMYLREARMIFVMSFCLSACIIAAPKKIDFRGIEFGGFYGNLSRKSESD